MRIVFHLLLNVAFVCSAACTPKNSVTIIQDCAIDSVLVYKIKGLKEFIKVADYWGDDTDAYLAFDKANAILDSISDNSNYEESLARIYEGTRFCMYGPMGSDTMYMDIEGEVDCSLCEALIEKEKAAIPQLSTRITGFSFFITLKQMRELPLNFISGSRERCLEIFRLLCPDKGAL